MLKHHCEGFKGWFDSCPVMPDRLAPGELFSTTQLEYLTAAAIVVVIVIGLIVVSLFMTALIGMFDD